jgi:hypothetical protein
MAAVAFGEGRLMRRADFAKAALAATAESRLEAAPTKARCFMAFSLQPKHLSSYVAFL